jgi:hypothetical protein
MFRPVNYKELFNLRHAELRNVIERIIGVFKKRFKIVREDNYYPMTMQARLIPALCALHNFIRIHDPSDDMDITQEEIDEMLEDERPSVEGNLQTGVTAVETERASRWREQIAQSMWVQYRDYNDWRNARRRDTQRFL